MFFISSFSPQSAFLRERPPNTQSRNLLLLLRIPYNRRSCRQKRQTLRAEICSRFCAFRIITVVPMLLASSTLSTEPAPRGPLRARSARRTRGTPPGRHGSGIGDAMIQYAMIVRPALTRAAADVRARSYGPTSGYLLARAHRHHGHARVMPHAPGSRRRMDLGEKCRVAPGCPARVSLSRRRPTCLLMCL